MNEVEVFTWNVLRELILRIDPERKGWCIDVGVGNQDFYFEWFANFGYPTVAAEPFVIDAVRQSAQERGVILWQGALSGIVDTLPIFTDGNGLTSLLPTAWADVREMTQIGTVLCTTYPELLRFFEIRRVTALKLDVEGAEGLTLSLLPGTRHKPAVVSFEFGGHVAKRERRGPWADGSMKILQIACVKSLAKAGYKAALVIAGGDGVHLRPVAIDGGNLDGWFDESDVWGNIVAVRRKGYDLVGMAQTELRFAP